MSASVTAAAPRSGGPQGAMAQALGSFAVPHFAKVFVGGFLWSVCRWALGFLAAYLVSARIGSPRLVQLTGTFMWAPLLLAGSVGGALADRVDRRTVVLAQFGGLLPLVAAVGVAATTDRLPTWVIYPFMVAVGAGWVVDMTARRALIYDLVGPTHVNGAMALEQFSSSVGLALGALAGGTVIELLGIGAAYLAVAGVMAVALVVLSTLPKTERPVLSSTAGSSAGSSAGSAAAPRASFRQTVAEGFRALPANPALVSILGVTLIVNLFHFSYFPIVTVIAKRVDATPFLTGLLAASTGIGMAIGAFAVAALRPRRGRIYCAGAAAAFVIVIGFALFRSYGLVFASLLVASIGTGCFGAMQSALVITAVPDELRGRAMGLLSMAIGGLPVGMYLLGEVAQHVGAPTALVLSNLAGLVTLGVFLAWRPQVLHID